MVAENNHFPVRQAQDAGLNSLLRDEWATQTLAERLQKGGLYTAKTKFSRIRMGREHFDLYKRLCKHLAAT